MCYIALRQMEKTKEQADWIAQTRRGVLELCLLILLAGEPRYGYELLTALGRWPSLEAPEGTIYPLLRRLERGGNLESSWRESPSGPPRRYYVLTAAGRRELERKSNEWEAITKAVADLIRTGGVKNGTRV